MSARVRWAGHATVELEADGSRLVTDPILRGRVSHLFRYAPGVAVAPGPAAVLLSHGHHDHLDLPALRELRPAGPVLVPRGLGGVAARGVGARLVHEVEAGDVVEVGPWRITVVPAEHDGRRLPFGPPQAAVGFRLDGPARILFPGDTDLHDGLERGAAGGLDLALLPIAGWGPSVGPGHLDPERAARAAARLGAPLVVPIHWGTYASPGSRPADPQAVVREFAGELAAHAPGARMRALAHGAALEIG